MINWCLRDLIYRSLRLYLFDLLNLLSFDLEVPRDLFISYGGPQTDSCISRLEPYGAL